ncbi:MAG: glyoxylase-like metal-dependent hydrolase (beta-lactamase superfamily II) [Acidimicrobiales bacterium]|jgi:glyoxylase-like metal-dependent hydrolase (beta-lactamase superfamily II)
MDDRLYFRQLLSGRDFATSDPIARQMVNFCYVIGDKTTGEAVVVDPAYDTASILSVLDTDGMRLTGVLATHYHADHVGGDMMGHSIHGVSDLLEQINVPVHVQAAEAEFVTKVTGIGDDQMVSHASGDVVTVGEVEIELIHTPGHTPGSQCFLVHDHLVSGDTLFLDGCGRTDFPGGDPEELYRSLTERLAKVSDDAVLYPGHLYSPEPSKPMGETRRENIVYRPDSLEQWLMMFGH